MAAVLSILASPPKCGEAMQIGNRWTTRLQLVRLTFRTLIIRASDGNNYSTEESDAWYLPYLGNP